VTAAVGWAVVEPLRVAQEAAREAARRHLSTRSDDAFESLLKANGAVVGAVITLLETDR
jgi:hypothetical protein